eukprot:1085171-Pleurochrysis_carterae.AAC.1
MSRPAGCVAVGGVRGTVVGRRAADTLLDRSPTRTGGRGGGDPGRHTASVKPLLPAACRLCVYAGDGSAGPGRRLRRDRRGRLRRLRPRQRSLRWPVLAAAAVAAGAATVFAAVTAAVLARAVGSAAPLRLRA